MDVAVEVEEQYEESNFTLNETQITYYNGLYPHQIGMFFFSIFCLIPNILIVYIICRNKMSSTVYWTITNWSLLNAVLILNYLPLTLIPAATLNHVYFEATLYIGITFSVFTALLAMLFMFDCFVKSERICKYSNIGIWIVILSFNIAVIVVTGGKVSDFHMALVTQEIVCVLLTLAFFVKIIYSCCKPSQEDTSVLRTRLCSTYLLGITLLWCTDFTLYIHHFFIILSLIATMIVYLDGCTNLVILAYLDPRVRRHLMQMLCRSNNYADLKFDARNLAVQIVDQPS